jgi:hypothetical protein
VGGGKSADPAPAQQASRGPADSGIMSDRAVVQIPVTLDAANRRKDRSVSL